MGYSGVGYLAELLMNECMRSQRNTPIPRAAVDAKDLDPCRVMEDVMRDKLRRSFCFR